MYKDQVTVDGLMLLTRHLYCDPLATVVLGGGCSMTSLASSDVLMILASAHVQMP